MDEVTIGSNVYQIDRMSAWTACDVLRRIFPLLTALREGVVGKMDQATVGAEPDLKEAFFSGLDRMGNVLAKMPKDDYDFVLRESLRVCKLRQENGAWGVLMSGAPGGPGQLMFQHLSPKDIYQLAVMSIQRQEGLVDFFLGPAEKSPSASPPLGSLPA